MATTVEIILNAKTWTNVSNGGVLGFITNEGNQPAVYIESESTPDDTNRDGHTLKVKDFVNFSIIAPAEVYFRAASSEAKIKATVE